MVTRTGFETELKTLNSLILLVFLSIIGIFIGIFKKCGELSCGLLAVPFGQMLIYFVNRLEVFPTADFHDFSFRHADIS